MKKIFLFCFMFLIMGLSLFNIPSVYALESSSAQVGNYSFRAYGDSISAGFGLSDYNNYLNGSDITAGSYPDVFAKPYINSLGGNMKGYGVSGDTSADLVADLQGYINKTASDFSNFYNTDFFTLCIGANNILGPAIDNITAYLSNNLADDEYRTYLQAGLSQFQTDYLNSILPCLTQNPNSKIYVMTIYNPYKHTSITDIKVNTGNGMLDSVITSTLATYNSKLQTMLSTTMEYLQAINDIIRNSTSENVIVIDIYDLFETFTKEQYLQYINADASQIVITSMDDINNITELFRVHCDPHPTAAGHKVIAEKHIEKLTLLKFELLTNLNNITNDEQLVTFKISQAGGKSSTYKLMKKDGIISRINATISLSISSSHTGSANFNIKAKELIGQGVVYIESYSGATLITKSNELNYSYESKDVIVPDEPTEPSKPTQPDNSDDEIQVTDSDFVYTIIIVADLAIFVIAILIGCFKL